MVYLFCILNQCENAVIDLIARIVILLTGTDQIFEIKYKIGTNAEAIFE